MVTLTTKYKIYYNNRRKTWILSYTKYNHVINVTTKKQSMKIGFDMVK